MEMSQTCRSQRYTILHFLISSVQFDFGGKQIKGSTVSFHAECDMCRWRKRTQGRNQALRLLLLCNIPDPSAAHAILNRSIASLYGRFHSCFRCICAKQRVCQTSTAALHSTRNNWSSWRAFGGAAEMPKGNAVNEFLPKILFDISHILNHDFQSVCIIYKWISLRSCALFICDFDI